MVENRKKMKKNEDAKKRGEEEGGRPWRKSRPGRPQYSRVVASWDRTICSLWEGRLRGGNLADERVV